MKACRALLLLWATGLVLLSQPMSPVFAAGETIEVTEAHAFQNLVETGDILILIRYELPTSQWQNATFMEDSTCAADTADETNWEDPCWTSLLESMVVQRFYDGPAATGIIQAVREVPRINHGLNAVYLPPAHGLTFGDTSYETCVEGNPSVFVPLLQTCADAIQWHSSADLDATPGIVAPVLRDMMRRLELALLEPPTKFINVDKITETGALFPKEAFAALLFVAPEAFFAGVESTWQDFAPTPVASSALQADIQAAAQASMVWQAANAVSEETFGVSVRLLGSFLILLAAAVLMGVVIMMTKEPALGALFGSFPIMFGVFMDFIPIQAVWVVTAAFVVLGGVWVFRKVPS